MQCFSGQYRRKVKHWDFTIYARRQHNIMPILHLHRDMIEDQCRQNIASTTSAQHCVHNVVTTLHLRWLDIVAWSKLNVVTTLCPQHPHNVSTLLRRPRVVEMSMSPECCEHNVVATLLRRRHDIGIQRGHNVEKSSHKNIVPTLKINVVTIFN